MWEAVAAFRCRRCGEICPRWRRALRSPRRRRLAICGECLESWQRTGRRCARCWGPILDGMEIGMLVDTRAFAHVDCGGARVSAP
jgi:hypothetical protein